MAKVSKMAKGGSLGMKSVKAGFDKNPGVTRADIIVAGKKEAKGGKKLVKKAKYGKSVKKAEYGCPGGDCGKPRSSERQAARQAKKAMRSPKFKAGGKCKYGC